MRWVIRRMPVLHLGIDQRHSCQYSLPMAVGPRGDAQINVTCDNGTNRFDLRLYNSEEFIVPCWWIGVSDQTGELCRTEVSSAAKVAPSDLRRWLSPIVGPDTSGRLVRLAVKASTDARRKRRAVGAR